LDVGIGFGKNLEHNLQLLRHLSHFTKLNRPLLVGVSRKSFLGKAAPGTDRLVPGLACACWAVAQGAHIIRTHDAVETRQALQMWDLLSPKS
jgi:dihydropteroate synthase